MNIDAQPIVFLAFANDRQRDGAYLRNLAQEAAQIRAKLEAVPHLCKIVERHGATPAQILEIFRQNKDRIAIFHYAGHAEDFELLLETGQGERTRADARGLLEFLRQQRGLQLVFLNACSTRAQVEAMHTADVPAVIATSRAVDDTLATAFAADLYAGLAAGDSLAAAYATAQAAVQFTLGDVTRHLRPVENPYQEHADAGWPWGLYVRPGSESVRGWNLPDAAGDPLFGLPSLPPGDLPASPFRNILWFRREDAPVFFGRGYDIRELFQRITAVAGAPILLYYGQSGVGKSSLLAAGLLPRLEQVQTVVCVRRDQALGLLGTLEKSVPAVFAGHGNVSEYWRAVENETGRPLTVILDQVEEVYTRPNKDNAREMSDFLDVLVALVADPAARPRGRVVLSFRKEYLQELGDLLAERRLPRAEVSLKRLDRRGIVEAVTGPARSERLQQHFGLNVEEGLAGEIADDLLGDPSSAVAPTLQILLSKLWEQAKARSYEHPIFDRPLYDDLRRRGLLLSDFLDQQLAALRSDQSDAAESGLALDLLAFHTTQLGTAEQRTLAELRAAYAHQAMTLGDLLAACRDLYLLADPVENRPVDEASFRLAHDTLAPLVRRRFEESDAPGQRARRILESRLPAKSEAESAEQRQDLAPLGDADLAVVEAGRAGMRAWRAQEEDLVAISQEERARRQAEQARIAEEGVRAALALQKRFRIALAAAIIAVILLVVAGVAVQQLFVAQGEARAEAAKAEAEAQNARRAEATAQAEARRARSGELAALAVGEIETDPELGILLALEAISTTQDLRATAAISTTQADTAETALRLALLASHAEATLPQGQPVMAIDFSPDGKQLVSGAWGLPIQVWDITTSRWHQLSAGDESPTLRLDYDSASNRIASAHQDGTVRLWDADTTGISKTLSGHSGVVWDVDFSPDGSRLASGGEDGRGLVWDTSSGQIVYTLPVTSGVHGVAFSSDGEFVATASQDGVARVWDLATSSPVFTTTPTSPLWGVALSPQDGVLAVSGQDRSVTLWQIQNPAQPIRTLKRTHTDTVYAVDFSSDGERLISADAAGTAVIWDVSDLGDIGEMARLKGHENTIFSAVFAPDGMRAATASYDGSAKIWLVAEHHGWIRDLSFDPHHPDRLITASRDGTAKIWTFQNGRLVLLHTLPHGSDVRRAVFSPDGKLIATAGVDGTAKIWDAETFGLLYRLTGHTATVNGIAFNSDGTRLATASYDGRVGIWDAATGKRIRFLQDGDAYVNDVAFGPDGTYLAAAGEDNTARLWQADTGLKIREFRGHRAAVDRVVFSPDGSKLATASTDTSAMLWNVENATAVYTFTEHADRIFGLAFDSTGSKLATAAADGRIVVRDLVTGQKQEILAPGEAYGVAFSPDGTYVLFSGDDDNVHVQALQGSDLVVQAVEQLTREWRLDECSEYLNVPECPPVAAYKR